MPTLRQALLGRWGILLLSGLVFAADLLTPTGWADPILYLVPLALSYDLPRRRLPLELSAVYTVLILIGSYLSPLGIDTVGTAVNRVLIIGVIWIFALAMVNRKQLGEQTATAMVGREQAERQLSASEVRFTQLVSEVRDYAILMLGPDGRVESWNAGGERMTGYRADEVIGSHFARLYRPEDVAAGHPESLLAQAAREGRVEHEGWRIRKDGTQFLADVVITALRTPEGQVSGYAKIVRDVTERNRLQEQFRLAVEASPSGMVLTDEQGRIKLANARIEAMFGYHRDELIDQTVEILVPEAVRGAHQQARHAFMVDPEPRQAGKGRELSGRRKDGTMFPLEISLNPIRTVSGLRILAAVVDISERRRAETERRALDERLRSILNSMEEVVWSSSVDLTQIHYISSSAAQVYGRPADEFLGDPMLWLKAIHDEDQNTAMKAAERLHQTGQFDAQYRIVRPDGTVRWLHDRGRVIKDDRGQPLRVDGIAIDITDRRAAEAALRESEARFRNTLDNLMEGGFIVRFDWTFLYVNEAGTKHARRTRDELLGRTVPDIYPGIGRTELFDKLRHCMTTRTTVMHETEFIYPDGSTGVFDVKIQPVPEGIFVLSNDITERKRTERQLAQLYADLEERVRARTQELANANQELHESSRRFRAIFNSTFQFTGLLSTDGMLIEVNQSALEFIGVPGSQVLGRPFWNTPWWSHSTEEQQRLREAIESAARGEFIRFETTHRSCEGQLAAIDFSVKPICDENRTVVLLVAEGREITERKQAEQALKQATRDLDLRVQERTAELSQLNARLTREVEERRTAEQRLSQVVELAPSGMLLVDQTGTIRLINRRIEEQFGYQREELIGSPVEHLVPTSLRQAHRSYRGQFLDTPSVRAMGQARELHGLRKDGREFPLEIGLSPIQTPEGPAVLASVVDISARREAEHALRESQRQLATLIGNLPGYVYRCRNDPEWTLEYISAGVMEVTGYAVADYLVERTVTCGGKVHPDDRERIWQEVQTALTQGRPYEMTYRIMTKSGEVKWVWEKGSGICAPDGPLLHLEGFVTDVTGRKRLEEQLRRTERIAELGTLASGMAHEIGTPMNVILGRAEYLQQRTQDEGLKKGLGTIVTQVERITKVMNQLLAFARRRTPERRPVDLSTTIDDSLEMFQERLRRKQITVERHMDPQLPLVMADPDQMTQVMINLLMNSVHAMPDGGTLRIKAGRANRHATVEVSDTGHGMSQEVLDKIFDPFFTTKDTGEGTGLGLTVVKGIVEEHDGTISVASEVDKGTTVTVSLPIDDKL